MKQSIFIVLASVSGLVSVALGAFGSHALKDKLAPELIATYQTAVQYQMSHSLALLVVGALLLRRKDQVLLCYAGWLFALGILLFSGSLYLLSLFNWSWLGPVTPIGGLALMLGWAFLAAAAFKISS